MRDRSSLVTVVVAAITGVVAAQAAFAVGEDGPSAGARVASTAPPPAQNVAAHPAAPAPPAPPAAAVPPAPPGHQNFGDNEHEEPGENPYDETAPPVHAPVTRVPVIARDGMLHVPAGRFVMGSTNPRAPANERPPRTVSVSAFWMDRTEVTVGAYRACVDAHACSRPERNSATCTYDAGDGELPISCVHWRDADAYCRFAGKRLPNEVEWEYAARGTLPVAFPWGGASSCNNAITLISDASGRSCAARPVRVGSHPSGASIFGVQDMSGNVEEWTADWYAESLGAGPAPRTGAAHVLRGGGWLSPPSLSRATARNWGSAVEAGPNVGFRCARDD
jgi:formylglycine-generating enzyme required for sulfatase activity